MQYMVVTSKHHDGFCLFDSEWDSFNSAKGTPFGRDIIYELANACARQGLKFGLYYSQELDWHDPNGGGYKSGHTNCGCMSWTNDWDYPDNGHKDFSKCFEGKIKTQFKEILTKYGDLCLIWCDTPHVITETQSRELYDMIKKISARLPCQLANRQRNRRLPLLRRQSDRIQKRRGARIRDSGWRAHRTIRVSGNSQRHLGLQVV